MVGKYLRLHRGDSREIVITAIREIQAQQEGYGPQGPPFCVASRDWLTRESNYAETESLKTARSTKNSLIKNDITMERSKGKRKINKPEERGNEQSKKSCRKHGTNTATGSENRMVIDHMASTEQQPQETLEGSSNDTYRPRNAE